MLIFPTAEWVQEWISLTNESPEFRTAGQGWEGAIGLVVQGGPKEVPAFIRLNGRDGHWSSCSVVDRPDPVAAERIRLTADYAVWRLVIRQELHPLRGILVGRILVQGHLPDLLRYRDAVVTMCELAGRLDTTFIRA